MRKVYQSMKEVRLYLLLYFVFILCCVGCEKKSNDNSRSDKTHNIIYILSDDHRYDFMGFTGKVPFLKTPNMDKLAKEGVHMSNAFVTTALCSPSRASILTGQFTHRHGVVDNQSLPKDGTHYFPEFLQQAGYQTGFVGKWHMGEHTNQPRQGFDYWASFQGQGQYWNSVFNVNGTEQKPKDST